MQANDQNGNSINYLLHIQKMYEEQQQLELEHSRLRQQLNDHVILPQRNDSQCSNENNNGTVDDIRIQLDCEKAQSKSLKKEVVYLLEQVRRTQKRYNDLISIVKNDKERPSMFLHFLNNFHNIFFHMLMAFHSKSGTI